MHSISQHVGLRSAEAMSYRYGSSILNFITLAFDVHVCNGCNISSINADAEFKCIKFKVLIKMTQVPINILDAYLKNHPAEQ